MSSGKVVGLTVGFWLVAISFMHATLNLGLFASHKAGVAVPFRVGFLAPLAMRLREDGVPIKIVYLGQRDGTAMVVNRASQIYRIEDLRGKTIVVPNRFSNQKLLVVKALKEHGVALDPG
jgi:ABC-type nitrate/sulfonate/bicarbonate transport system substrate-binding protein